MAEELKRCPHCGGTARIGRVMGAHRVTCNCGVGLAFAQIPELIAAWNTRTPDPELTTLRARVKELEEARDTALDEMRRCHNDGGFDREIGPIGCLLGDQCVCIGLYPILKGAAS